jgi:hypothetical protein
MQCMPQRCSFACMFRFSSVNAKNSVKGPMRLEMHRGPMGAAPTPRGMQSLQKCFLSRQMVRTSNHQHADALA